MSIYHLYGSASADTEGLASCDVQFDGEIVAVHFAVAAQFNAHADQFAVEVSFISSTTLAKNDARGVIYGIRGKAGLLTSGGFVSHINEGLSGLQIPVVAGERVYMHVSEYVAAQPVECSCFLYVRDSADVNLRRRR